jgi:hypothetical protein
LEEEQRVLEGAHPPAPQRLRDVGSWLAQRRGDLAAQRGLLEEKQLVGGPRAWRRAAGN